MNLEIGNFSDIDFKKVIFSFLAIFILFGFWKIYVHVDEQKKQIADLKKEIAGMRQIIQKTGEKLQETTKEKIYYKESLDFVLEAFAEKNEEIIGLRSTMAKKIKAAHKEKSAVKKKKLLEIGTILDEDGGSVTGPISRHILENPAYFNLNKNILREEAVEIAGTYAEKIGFINQNPEEPEKIDEIIIDKKNIGNLSIIPVRNDYGAIISFDFYCKKNGVWETKSDLTYKVAQNEKEQELAMIEASNFPYGIIYTLSKEEKSEGTFNIVPARLPEKKTDFITSGKTKKCRAFECLENISEIIPAENEDMILSSSPYP